MIRQMVCFGRPALFAAAVWMIATAAWSAPRIDKLSLRGLQAGGITTLVIEGAELLPEPQLHLNAAGVQYKIKDGATPQRLEAEFTIDGSCPSGIYLLRAASVSGISAAAALGIDNLPQVPFAPQVSVPSVAMSGSLSGSGLLSTSLTGKAGQQVLVEVESRRLGAKLNPVIHIYDARRTQLGYSRGLPAIGGDPRFSVKLPADGTYTIEIHDAVFRGEEPGFFRIKIGDFRYADVAYPLAVQQATDATFEFLATNLPADARAAAKLTPSAGLPRDVLPAPWPAATPLLSGSRPPVIVSDHAEVLEAAPTDKPQEVAAAPIAINGRIGAKGEADRFRLAVTPGQTLKFDVLARRAGSALDGVLSIQNEQGAELAGSDDRPGTSDPGLDFKVPDGVNAVLVVVRDLRGQGGAEFVYRVGITPVGAPDYTLSIPSAAVQIPKDGAAIVRVKAQRSGYGGPIALSFPQLPANVSLTGGSIPAGAVEALVTLSAPGLNPAQSLTEIIGASDNGAIKRRASLPTDQVAKDQPWLGTSLALAVTTPAPLQLAWDLFADNAQLAQGVAIPTKLRVTRGEGVKGTVRLSLLSTQPMPRKKIKENNQEREVDDVERSLRFEGAPQIAADQTEAAASILVPSDLAVLEYDLAIQAELLADDNKTVVAVVTTPARRLATIVPVRVELAAAAVEARAGVGPTGTISGKIHRAAGYALPINLTLAGLPQGVASPTFTVAADQTDFSFPVTLPYGTAAGELKNVKLAAVGLLNPADPKSELRAAELPLAVKVVPGGRPPMPPHAVFEDQPEFVASLVEGGGQATLDAEQKYSGAASVKVTPDQKFNPALPGLGMKIRENPGPGEFRYLRFAWKKQGGQAVCLQLNHDGQWGPAPNSPASFRYHAGTGGQCFGASLAIDAALPEQWEVVTRDLFADFGEFTLTGLALSPMDGDFAQFDHIYLGSTVEDFRSVKP
jgi:hypothetical protein